MENAQYLIQGRIVDRRDERETRGLRVVAHAGDAPGGSPLSRTEADADGGFEISFTAKDLAERGYEPDPRDKPPNLFLELYEGKRPLENVHGNRVVELQPGTTEVTIYIGDVVERTRTQFKTLMLGNPNYFGTFPELDFPVVAPQSGNTGYEEAVCLGLHPDQDRLETVVHIKRPFGYGGDPCDDGSTEYVRFFVERPGTGWEDLGVATLNVYDMPAHALPLSYTVAIEFDDPRKYCTTENLLHVRAILSWNLEPPAGNATWSPPWGNAIDATVQIDAFRLPDIAIADLVADKIVEIDPSLLDQIEASKPLPVKPSAPLPYAKLKQIYEGQDVPKHRFGFAAAHSFANAPLKGTQLLQAAQGGFSDLTTDIPSADLADIFDDLVATTFDTRYEELLCAGYNPATREVGGVLTIKRNAGYSGGLCSDGSIEYVGFWVRYDGAWHALGIAQVHVFDLAGIGGGKTVEYAVLRPTNGVPEFPCEDVSGLPLRAILSWNTPPTGPNYHPTWGNVVNTFIQPGIGEVADDDAANQVRLFHINRAPLDAIDDTTGRATNPSPTTGECGGVDRPFGNVIYVEGDFLVKPHVFHNQTGDVLPGAHPSRYRVYWKKAGDPGLGTQLTNAFAIRVYPQNPPPGPISVVKTQQATPDGSGVSYTYYESIFQAVNPRILALWNVSSFDNGLYTLIVQGLGWNGTQYVPTNYVVQNLYVYNGFPHTVSVAAPDGTTMLVPRKEPELTLTMDAGECSDISVGDPVTGTYVVRDQFFGSLGVRMTPITFGGSTFQNPVTITNPGAVVPHPGVTPSTQTVSGAWTLPTTGLPPCGYTVELGAWDRALVGLSCHGHYNRIAVGFCLREPIEP